MPLLTSSPGGLPHVVDEHPAGAGLEGEVQGLHLTTAPKQALFD